MKCKEFYFNGEENINIHVYKWEDNYVKPKGVVQISHGMRETAIR
jgi:alpha-beta hydrolase superfamily lysophospholipase